MVIGDPKKRSLAGWRPKLHEEFHREEKCPKGGCEGKEGEPPSNLFLLKPASLGSKFYRPHSQKKRTKAAQRRRHIVGKGKERTVGKRP